MPSITNMKLVLIVALLASCAKSAAVSGKVVRGFDGAPVAGATVTAKTKTDIQEEKKFETLVTKTNEKGEFHLATSLADRKYEVTIEHADYFNEDSKLQFPALDQTKDLPEPVKLVRLPTLEGRVLACVDKTPLANVRVKAIPEVREATTDARGVFKIEKLPQYTAGIDLTIGGVTDHANVRAEHIGDGAQRGDFFVCVNTGDEGIKVLQPPYRLVPVAKLQGLGWRATAKPISRDQGVRKLWNGQPLTFEDEAAKKAHYFDIETVEGNLAPIKKDGAILLPTHKEGYEQYRLYRHNPRRYRIGDVGRLEFPAGHYLGIHRFTTECKESDWSGRQYCSVGAIFESGDAVSLSGEAVGTDGKYQAAKVTGEVGAIYVIVPLAPWSDSMYNAGGVNWGGSAYFVQVTEDGNRSPVRFFIGDPPDNVGAAAPPIEPQR